MIELDHAHREFIAHLKEKDRAQATVLAYGKDIEQLLGHTKHLGRAQVHEIEKGDLQDFLDLLEKEGYTKKSISRKINSTKTFFRFLKINEYITDDPAALISHPRFETPPPRILSETEYRALRDAARNDVRTFSIIELLLQTGIRIGELSEIKLDQIELLENNLSGQLSILESRASLARTIPLNEAAVRALAAYLKVRPQVKNDYLYVTRSGNPLLVRNIRGSIDRCFRKAGVKNVRVNDLRHTFIAHHIKRGASIILISKIAGHKRLATTEKYLKYLEQTPGEKLELEVL